MLAKTTSEQLNSVLHKKVAEKRTYLISSYLFPKACWKTACNCSKHFMHINVSQFMYFDQVNKW